MTAAHGGENDREHFLGLVFLLRQLAVQLLEHGQDGEARGLIDALAALERKTQGNLDEEEAKFLSSVLHELRMSVLAGGARKPSGADEPAGAEPRAGE